MAELSEAFTCFNNENQTFQNIDYFFTQRNMKEQQQYLDKNMNRKNKQINIIYNFLAISIPVHNDNKEFNYNIEIFGDLNYQYKGSIKSYQGSIPNLLIPLKGDKKIFIHITYKENKDTDINSKDYICFVEVPKRFQSIDPLINNLKNNTDDTISIKSDSNSEVV